MHCSKKVISEDQFTAVVDLPGLVNESERTASDILWIRFA